MMLVPAVLHHAPGDWLLRQFNPRTPGEIVSVNGPAPVQADEQPPVTCTICTWLRSMPPPLTHPLPPVPCCSARASRLPASREWWCYRTPSIRWQARNYR